jgi:hypothetical protein
VKLSTTEIDRLRAASEVTKGVMAKLDAGPNVCEHCGATTAKDKEARAMWEILNAANTRLEKIIGWTGWDEKGGAQ